MSKSGIFKNIGKNLPILGDSFPTFSSPWNHVPRMRLLEKTKDVDRLSRLFKDETMFCQLKFANLSNIVQPSNKKVSKVSGCVKCPRADFATILQEHDSREDASVECRLCDVETEDGSARGLFLENGIATYGNECRLQLLPRSIGYVQSGSVMSTFGKWKLETGER